MPDRRDTNCGCYAHDCECSGQFQCLIGAIQTRVSRHEEIAGILVSMPDRRDTNEEDGAWVYKHLRGGFNA